MGKSQNALAQDILKTKNDPCDGRKTMFFLTPTCLVKKNKIQNTPAQLNYNKSSQVSTKEKKKILVRIRLGRKSTRGLQRISLERATFELRISRSTHRFCLGIVAAFAQTMYFIVPIIAAELF